MGYENTCAKRIRVTRALEKNIVSQIEKKYCVQAPSFKIWWRGLFFFIFQLSDCQLFDLQKKKKIKVTQKYLFWVCMKLFFWNCSWPSTKFWNWALERNIFFWFVKLCFFECSCEAHAFAHVFFPDPWFFYWFVFIRITHSVWDHAHMIAGRGFAWISHSIHSCTMPITWSMTLRIRVDRQFLYKWPLKIQQAA